VRWHEERMVRGEDSIYLLTYDLELNRGSYGYQEEEYYGIRVDQYQLENEDKAGREDRESCLIDQSRIRGLTEDRSEAESFLSMAVEGRVMPVTLYDVYDDWMSAFHPRWYFGG